MPTEPSVVRTIQYDDAMLYLDGDAWIFAFPTKTGEFYIVGRDVNLVEEADTHVVVNLNQSPTQKSRDEPPGSHTLINVSKTGVHKVRVVTRSGIAECDVEPPNPVSLSEFLGIVLSSHDSKSGRTKP